MAESTGAYIYTPGVQHLFVHFRNEGTPRYWGTAVTAPEFEEMPKYIEIQNDVAGRNEPVQLVYDGTSALVSVTLNRLDAGIMRTIKDHAYRLGGFTAGKDDYLSRGSLVLGRNDFSVIVTNQYAGTAASSPGMHAGRKYYACTVQGMKESAAGTRAWEVAVVLRAWSLWQGHGGGFLLYTEDPSQFGTLTLG